MFLSEDELTLLLNRASSGDKDAMEQLFPKVYDDLDRIAKARLRLERVNHTLQPTALINEAYLKLFGSTSLTWQNRAHFFASVARQMRFILVDHARRRLKAGPSVISIEDVEGGEQSLPTVKTDDDLVALDEALKELEGIDPRAAKIVELRFFAGLNLEEIAETLDVHVATVVRDLTFARSWLYNYLS